MKILVTGGAGFIGSHSVDLLLAEGNEVIVLDNLVSGKKENLPLGHPNLKFVEGDILEFPLLQEIISECDAVLHLAAFVSVPGSIEFPVFSSQVNTQGSLHVLEVVRKTGRKIRIVQASSAAVYGESKILPARDDLPLATDALSPYALQKIQAEEYAKLYSRLHQIGSLSLRYFNIYGPRQNPDSPYSGVISRFLDAYQKNQELRIFGDGLQTRDFIHVEDIAKANWLALQSDFTGVVNIATGAPKTLLQVIDYFNINGGHPANIQHYPERAGDIRASYAAIERAEKHLGFKFTISQEQGMKMMVRSCMM